MLDVEKQLGVQHPLARQEFKTDGVELFVERFGRLVNVSQVGQLAIREAFGARLERVEYEDGRAARLFPLLRAVGAQQPALIVIDPERAFGRPSLARTAIPVEVIQERFKAVTQRRRLPMFFGARPFPAAFAPACVGLSRTCSHPGSPNRYAPGMPPVLCREL